MADEKAGSVNTVSDGGVSGKHPEPEPLKFFVGPTTSNQYNTIRLFSNPIACWRVDDIRFAFDSSFVNADPTIDNPNDIRAELAHLVSLRKDHPQSPLSVFGHADPVGDDDYNKKLSGRRATVIYGLLIANGDPALAVQLWQKVATAEHWGKDQRQTMEQLTGLGSATPLNSLIQSYIQKLCPPELKLSKTDFLAQGADSHGKGDYQGCSEFNPVLLFSKEDQDKFDQARQRRRPDDQATIDAQNAANAPNRRVLVLLFRKGSKVDPAKWPCPTASDGVAGCKLRFWKADPDGEKRRSTHISGKVRKFEDTEDTFGCRFFQRISSGSPCAAVGATVLEVRASIAGAKGIRNKANQKATTTLRSSTSSEESLEKGKNEPVILVRGCTEVDLEAITDAAGTVFWQVKPNQNSNPAPKITPLEGGKKAKLSTNQAGAFSVIASGMSRVVWNVVFVSVNVDVNSSVVITRDLYKDGFLTSTSDSVMTRFTSGEFTPNKFTWELNVKKIELVGGGSKNDIGIDQVQLHYIQNGTQDTLAGHYIDGGLAEESPQGGIPVVDSNGDATVNPTADGSLVVTPATNTGATRSVQMSDSPAGQFVREHLKTKKLLQTIDGVIEFRAAVGSSSTDAPNVFVVHAELKWKADYDGKVKTRGPAGTYTPDKAHTSSDPILQLISPATGGQEAGSAGFELFEPRFNNGRDTKFTPLP